MSKPTTNTDGKKTISKPVEHVSADDLSKAPAAELPDDIDLSIDVMEEEDEGQAVVEGTTRSEASYAARIRDLRKIGEGATAYMTALDYADEYPASFNAWRFLFEMDDSPATRREHLGKMSILADGEKEKSYLRDKAPLVLEHDKAAAKVRADKISASMSALREERVQAMADHSLMKPEEWMAVIDAGLVENQTETEDVEQEKARLEKRRGREVSSPHVYLFMILGVLLGAGVAFLIDGTRPLMLCAGALIGFAVGVVASLLFSVFFSMKRANAMADEITAADERISALARKREELEGQRVRCHRAMDLGEEIDGMRSALSAAQEELAAVEEAMTLAKGEAAPIVEGDA